jgi:hypothetical protein
VLRGCVLPKNERKAFGPKREQRRDASPSLGPIKPGPCLRQKCGLSFLGIAMRAFWPLFRLLWGMGGAARRLITDGM